MKIFNTFLLLLFALGFTVSSASAQTMACNSEVNFSLDNQGEVLILPEYILESQINSTDEFLLTLQDQNTGETILSGASLLLDCSHAGSYSLAVQNTTTNNSCWSTIIIEDKLRPVPYCINLSTAILDENTNSVELWAIDFNAGSTDNCGIKSYTFGDFAFDFDGTVVNGVTYTDEDIFFFNENGPISFVTNASTETIALYDSGLIQLWDPTINSAAMMFISTLPSADIDANISMTDEVGNSDYCTIAISLVNNSIDFNGSCVASITAYPQPWECAPDSLVASDFVDPILNFSNAEISLDGINYSAVLNTPNLNIGQNYIYTKYIVDGNEFECLSSVLFVDNIPPVPVVEQSIIVELVANAADFTCTDPLDQLITSPLEVITIYDDEANTNMLQPSILQFEYGYAEEDVQPTWNEACPFLASTYTDITTDLGNDEWQIERTFTTLNWLTSSTITHVQLIKSTDLDGSDNLYCLSNQVISIGNESVQVFPIDLLITYAGDQSELTLTIADSVGGYIIDNIISPEYIGSELAYTITNNVTGETCSSTITIIEEIVPCSSPFEDNIAWPLAEIYITDPDVVYADLLPESLVQNYGFGEEQVNPVLLVDCGVVGSTWEDAVFYIENSNILDKVVRTFTIFDWVSWQTATFEQVIHNGITPNDFICDILPRTAPLGDCESGHTDADDVEWPADLAIVDYRITPEELVSFSGVDVLDSRPSYYNSLEAYTDSYVDLVESLTPSLLKLNRVWTVERTAEPTLSFTYIQNIEVDFTDFAGLVGTNTHSGNAIESVIINNNILTDTKGTAYLGANDVETISKSDDIMLGIDSRDLALIRAYILGEISLNPYQLIAADINQDNQVTSLDFLLLSRIILGASDEETVDWNFVENTSSFEGLRPKANYIGVKPGDVDDSYTLYQGRDKTEDIKLQYEDKLLNAGEQYNVEINLTNSVVIRGTEIKYEINSSTINVINVSHEHNADIDWNVDGEYLTIVTSTETGSYEIAENTPIFNIEFEAVSNGILSDNMKLEFDIRSSYYVDLNFDYVPFEESVNGVISSVFEDPANALSFMSVYPNPASSIINFDFTKVNAADVTISIQDITGRSVMSARGGNTIDVSQLQAGVYVYKITDGLHTFTNKIMVID